MKVPEILQGKVVATWRQVMQQLLAMPLYLKLRRKRRQRKEFQHCSSRCQLLILDWQSQVRKLVLVFFFWGLVGHHWPVSCYLLVLVLTCIWLCLQCNFADVWWHSCWSIRWLSILLRCSRSCLVCRSSMCRGSCDLECYKRQVLLP